MDGGYRQHLVEHAATLAGRTLLEQAATDHPTLRKAWVDGGYCQHLVEHAASSASTSNSSNVLPVSLFEHADHG
ncbi:hypothetical protein OHO81_44030 [Streptomyces pseudovenezuelae]|nr:hypothetical protein OHO81_44030 [Streptomyces pseudovenezuelae]